MDRQVHHYKLIKVSKCLQKYKLPRLLTALRNPNAKFSITQMKLIARIYSKQIYLTKKQAVPPFSFFKLLTL